MRTFKIIITTAILLALAILALMAIKGFIPSAEPVLDEHYHEDEHLDDVDDIYSQQLKQFEGIVKVLGISIYGEGTHRLEKDEKLELILESEKVNLPDFEGKEVKVRGFVRDTVEGGQKIMDVAYIEMVAEAGVKLFNEVGYEFSFSYPSDWEVKKEADKVTFLQKNGEASETIIVIYQYEDVKGTLETWLKDRDQNLFYEETQVKIGSSTGVRRTVKNGDQEIVKTYAKEGNNAYELRLVSQDEVVRNQYFSIVDFFKTSFIAESQVENDEELTLDEAELAEESEALETSEETAEEADSETVTEDEIIEEEEATNESEEDENNTESAQSFSNLTPLTQADVDRVIEKGFSPFQGRTLGFEYPKLWYFSYLGDGKYGLTDETTFKDNGEEVTEDTSRVLLVMGTLNVSCTEKSTKEIDGTTYTVCARETGLSQIIERMSGSITKPSL